MIDGAASLMTLMYGLHAAGKWVEQRGANMLDSGAHYYDTYETSDGKYVAVGSIEAKFYRELLRLSGLEREKLPAQNETSSWPAMKQRVTLNCVAISAFVRRPANASSTICSLNSSTHSSRNGIRLTSCRYS